MMDRGRFARRARRLVPGLIALPLGFAHAQQPEHTIAGTVFDSVARVPLAGAVVQLVASDAPTHVFGAVADSVGAYHVAGVPPGRYVAGFDHLSLQALGLEMPLVEVVVGSNDSTTTVNLAIPAPRTVRALRCVPGAAGSADGMLAGFVRDAAIESSLAGAKVELSWREVVIGNGHVQVARRVATVAVATNGSYVACGLPTDARIAMTVRAPGHVSGMVEIDLPDGGAARQDFFVADSASLNVTTDASGVHRLAGNATLSGRVRHRDGVPFTSARVGIVALDRQATVRDDGTYTMGRLPAGTWTVETRAIGYEPTSQPVVLRDGATTTASFSIDERVYTLDAVTIKGERPYMVQLFDDIARRKRLLSGTFFMAGDRQLEGIWRVTDLLRVARGFTVTNTQDIDIKSITTDSVTGQTIINAQAGYGNNVHVGSNRTATGETCDVHVYIDGNIFSPGFNQIDNTLSPNEIIAVEAYASYVDTPVQWRGMDQCGTVMIWTKRVRG